MSSVREYPPLYRMASRAVLEGNWADRSFIFRVFLAHADETHLVNLKKPQLYCMVPTADRCCMVFLQFRFPMMGRRCSIKDHTNGLHIISFQSARCESSKVAPQDISH